VQTCGHPLGGATGLTGGVTTSTQRKVEVGDRWRTHVAWEGVNPLLTYRVLGIRKGGARGLNNPTREVASCEGC
jgi:hypothetical protein